MVYTNTSDGVTAPAGADAFNPPVQHKATVDSAARFHNRVIYADATAMNAETRMIKGWRALTTDNGLEFYYDGTTWKVTGAGILIGRVSRSAVTPIISSAAYTNISATANWSTTEPVAQNVGFATYADGWTIPRTGIYLVNWSLAVNTTGLLAGITLDKSTGVTVDDFRLIATGALVQGVSAASSSGQLYLTSGQVLRLFAIASAGGATARASLGQFSLTWLRDV